MPSNRLPRHLLYDELVLGQRSVWRPKLRYSDHTKSLLRQCNIALSGLKQLAEDRELWSLTCASGLKNLTAASEQAASDRRAHRHAATPAGPVCPHCGRTCALDFALRSHLRIHLSALRLHQYNVIVEIDGLPPPSKQASDFRLRFLSVNCADHVIPAYILLN